MTVSPPDPSPQQRANAIAVGGHQDMLACMAQALLCLLGGGWAGYKADPQSAATLWIGAIGVFAAWFAAYAATHFVVMLFAPALIARDAWRWMRGGTVRNAGDERRLDAAMVVLAVLVLLGVSVLVALVVWVVATQASLPATLARFLLVAALASLLTSRAHRAVGNIQWGAPPP